MKTRTFAIALAIMTFSSAAFADDVKEISLKDYKPTGRAMGKATQPVEIKTSEVLEKIIGQEAVVAAIKKEVDFGKQKLVYFAWAGSGQDRVVGMQKKEEAVFDYLPGRTRDLRSHYKLFAVPKDAKIAITEPLKK